MSSNVPRVKESKHVVPIPAYSTDATRGQFTGYQQKLTVGKTTSKLWRSEGHRVNRKTGKYDSGGPFHVTHVGTFSEPMMVNDVCNTFLSGTDRFYSGPLFGAVVTIPAIAEKYKGTAQDWDKSSLDPLGATAISLCAPVNPTAQLGVAIGEILNEKKISLPGIESWKRRTGIAKTAGSEYLSKQFGWGPLVDEIHSTVDATRRHRDIMQNYRHNEGRDIHRRFDFPIEIQDSAEEISSAYCGTGTISSFANCVPGSNGKPAGRVCRFRKETKRWFEGCFTYGGPSGTDSFRRALGFGSEADQLYGLTLTPDVVWNLTPWTWAADWFSNAGDVVHNISNFVAAGLVMRYGFMMAETIEEYHTEYFGQEMQYRKSAKPRVLSKRPVNTPGKFGSRTVTKTRVPANPFGFGVGWEGLSPTQLAITAALGITRVL